MPESAGGALNCLSRLADTAGVSTVSRQLERRAGRGVLMARSGAALFVGEGLIALLANAVGGASRWQTLVVVGVSLAGFALAGVIFVAGARLRRWQTHLIVVTGAVLIAVVVGAERPVYGLLYVWLTLFVAALFRPRLVAAHVGWILVCDAVAVWISDPVGRPVEAWLLLAGILSGASAFVSIVRRHLTELADREREARSVLDTLFREAPVGLAVFDREFRYVRVNDLLASWSGLVADRYIGKRADEMQPGVGAQVEPAMQKVLETGQPQVGVIARTRGRIYQSSRYPITDDRGEITLIASIIDDITEIVAAREQLDQENRRLAEQARTDPLTGLASRRRFDEELDSALDRAQQNTKAVAVLYLDLDGLKQINDRHGHTAGDKLLRTFAKRLRTLARESDTIARIGGDEFALILPNLTPDSAQASATALAERIHQTVNHPVQLAGRPHRPTTSIGVAIYPHHADTAPHLVEAADTAMYQAKHQAAGHTALAANHPNRTVVPLRTAG
jgi:diguanylate cyclase (GGDEF)-like protein/PAS domain S-box-containing protein